jgi:RNA polymerase sigma-70 factor (ECF subfamily)
MFRVALNVYRAHLRGLGPEFVELEAALSSSEPAALADVADEPAGARDLRRAVAGLPERYREAILVHYFQGQDVRDAAAILGVAEGTLKARLSRARALLARSLGEGGAR